jgi:nucleosome binding factor SPN SPT16 subunit
LIVIIHVHLKTPIMIGKRKTKDVQFYRDATDMQFDETGNRRRKHRYGDEEEFEAEQEERRRRAALDRGFKAFAEKISDAGKDEGVDVDIPFREIGFNGVPNRSNVLIQPATDAIVQLTEPPFLTVTLSEIEVAHLERVQVSFLSG